MWNLATMWYAIASTVSALVTDSPDDTPMDRDSYRWSMEFFETNIAKQFCEFRRKEGDTSRAIVWNTQYSKMAPLLTDCAIGITKPMIIDLGIGANIPVVRIPNGAQVDDGLGLGLFPYEHIFSSQKCSDFHSANMEHQKIGSLKILLGRYMMFYLKCHPEWTCGNGDMDVFRQFTICEDLCIHHFFFTERAFKSYIKNNKQYFEKLLKTAGEAVYLEKSNKKKVVDAVRLNQENWNTAEQHQRINPDLSSIFDYTGVIDSDKHLHNLQIMEDNIVDIPSLSRATFLSIGGFLTPQYFRRAFSLFTAYRSERISRIRNHN